MPSKKSPYRLALDLSSTSIGWAVILLDKETPPKPKAIIKAGSRIFSDGRNPKDGSSLAVTRRLARSMRRRRDRLLKRKARMLRKLIEFGFFPQDPAQRKAAEKLNPYTLRAKGLDQALAPHEFARALFHINQRRGFKSNRKTDKMANEHSTMLAAINALKADLASFPLGPSGKPLPSTDFDLLAWVNRQLPETQNQNPRTVGEKLNQLMLEKKSVRARSNSLKGAKLEYDLYIDRAMIEAEFDALWAKQAALNPSLFHEAARADLKDTLLFQRQLKPVKPGRCALLPDEFRAPLALPSQQRLRMYQEVNHLRIVHDDLQEQSLSLEQRDAIISALDRNSKCSFTQIKKILKLPDGVGFNLENSKRQDLKGNSTSVVLSKAEHFGDQWFGFDTAKQDAIVMQLLTEESESKLIAWLQTNTGVDEDRAEKTAQASLDERYGSLSEKALAQILAELRKAVISYDKAVLAAGFDHHSGLSTYGEVAGYTFDTGIERIDPKTGEVQHLHAFEELPYYGEFLNRYVGFADPEAKPDDLPEKRFGRIPNPTVHISLNQVRKVVNGLIQRYGHPTEVIIELARDLKQSQRERQEQQSQQAQNQKRNDKLRAETANIMCVEESQVRRKDIEKMLLWEDLNPSNAADRCCPYSGKQISPAMLFNNSVEIDHVLPFSKTLDDSLNNKTVALREAGRIKGNRTPWEAKEDFNAQGWSYDEIIDRAKQMPPFKRYRFAKDGYQKWLNGIEDKNGKGFLTRTLNDTRYLSRMTCEYLSLICPQNTHVISGHMTAMLRGKFGLNDILDSNGIKNHHDHRHHAINACVIGVTDQDLLQRFAQSNAAAKEEGLLRLVKDMPRPWPSYRNQVERAAKNIWVSHKPEHGYEAEMFDQTIYNKSGYSRSATKIRSVIPFALHPGDKAQKRHGYDDKGFPKAYMGLLSNSNYCIEIIQEKSGAWIGETISTYQAYRIVAEHKNKEDGFQRLRNPKYSLSGRPLIMRLSIHDCIRIEIDDVPLTIKVSKINSQGVITFVKLNEANIPNRYAAKLAAQKALKNGEDFDINALEDDFFQKSFSARSLQKAKARRITISPIGILHDPGFRG